MAGSWDAEMQRSDVSGQISAQPLAAVAASLIVRETAIVFQLRSSEMLIDF